MFVQCGRCSCADKYPGIMVVRLGRLEVYSARLVLVVVFCFFS